MKFELIWFDSFGAKSSCTLVKTDDVSILIDPGVAIMHPSFPASDEEKLLWLYEGEERIRRAFGEADVVVISHYHWDHFIPDPKLYRGKLLLAKNPNEYINDSQRGRAVEFYSGLWSELGGKEIEFEENRKEFEEPELKSMERDFGDYGKRRKELLEKGRRWFEKRVERWRRYKAIPERKLKDVEIVYPEGREFKFGGTRLKFSKPLFHGIEYSRVGWVFSTVVDDGKEKLMHSSDLNGPIIEDYAEMIVSERPDYLILDGPMTYMLGYTLNLINLRRVLENVKSIVKELEFKLLIWDHHLPREPKFREHTKEVWELARRLKKNVKTASEHQLGKPPVVEG